MHIRVQSTWLRRETNVLGLTVYEVGNAPVERSVALSVVIPFGPVSGE
jgi:hypothetical protein